MLLITAFILAFNINPAEAQNIIYIRADGSIDPPTTPIMRTGNLYRFIDDIHASLIVEKDDIVIDGDGYTLYGLGYGIGMEISARRNVTVKSIAVTGFSYGITLDSSNYISLINTTVFNNTISGIYVTSSNHNFIANSTITDNDESGIHLRFSNHNNLSNNFITNNSLGIGIFAGTENILKYNRMIGNQYGFAVGYTQLYAYLNDVDSTNTVNGKPIYYWVNRSHETVPGNAGTVILVNSFNITVKNLKITNASCAVHLAFTSNSVIENVTCAYNENAIILDNARYNKVTRNYLYKNGAGLSVAYSSHNNITHNVVVNNEGTGIHVEDSPHTIVFENNISNNRGGGSKFYETKQYEGAGVWIDDSEQCNVTGNFVVNNTRGIVVCSEPGGRPARFNIITRNTLIENGVGIQFINAKWNEVYHNNLVNNGIQAIASMQSPNMWDNGYPNGGNYWSDYNGTDLFKGTFQNETGMDGVGDTPYTINNENCDNYPLTNPWSPTDISILNLSLSEAQVYVGRPVNITVEIVNRGVIDETFFVTCSYRIEGVDHLVGSRLVNLPANCSSSLVFNLTALSLGTYLIKAETTILPDETNPSDNNLTTVLKVKMFGDVNGDDKIDLYDIALVAYAFGSYPAHPRWNSSADINRDEKVNIIDLSLVAMNFGNTL